MPELPYHPNVKLGSIRQTTKKMMATKVGGAKVGDTQLKKFLKQEKGLRRVAYGDKTQSMEAWKGRHYMKEVKGKIETSEQFKETSYGRHHTAAEAFRDTVKEEIRQEEGMTPKGPNADEMAKQKRIEQAKQNLRKYEQQKQVEKEQGRALAAKQDAQANQKPARGVPLAGGSVGHVFPSGRATAGTAYAVSGGGGGTRPAGAELPSLFAFRGRVLRVDIDARTVTAHVLNAPTELAIHIGRDLTVHIPEAAHCFERQSPISLADVRASDFIDVRGRTVNGTLDVDELHRNNAELPPFVTRLMPEDAAAPETPASPDELVIG